MLRWLLHENTTGHKYTTLIPKFNWTLASGHFSLVPLSSLRSVSGSRLPDVTACGGMIIYLLFPGYAWILFLANFIIETDQSKIILAANNSIITVEYATGYVTQTWDDRMHILINITSCGTLIGQSLTKTAFAVTLLKLTKNNLKWILWFCIVSMNSYMIAKVILQWARVCGKSSYNVWYRLDFCLEPKFRDGFKEGGNGKNTIFLFQMAYNNIALVYNIIMDFVLATFPWIITWNLDMRRVEKVGLCIAMSLGMVVAIISAVRTSWKDDGNIKDKWYFWRNAHSNIWYSSEIVGTIIVQCIPVLRPLLRDIKTSLTSKRLNSVAGNTGRYSRWASFWMVQHRNFLLTVHRQPFCGPFGPTIGSKSTHKATIFSDARDTYLDSKNEAPSDSWDNQGIYQKKDFELTTVDVKAPKEDSHVWYRNSCRIMNTTSCLFSVLSFFFLFLVKLLLFSSVIMIALWLFESSVDLVLHQQSRRCTTRL